MPEVAPQRVYEIDGSAFNLPPRLLLLGHPGKIIQFAEQAGYRGLQMPYFRRVGGLALHKRLAAEGRIASLHQSFATGDGKAGRALQFVLGSVEGSLEPLKKIQDASERRLPLIVHPNEQWLGDKPSRRNIDYRSLQAEGRFAALLHQPTREVLESWGVLSARYPHITARNMHEIQNDEGLFDGVALDLHHLTAERAGAQLDEQWCHGFVSTLSSLGGLAGQSEVQLSYRSDFGGDPRSLQRAFLTGDLTETVQGRLLKTAVSSLPPGQHSLRITIETPPSEFEHTGVPYLEGNQTLVHMVRELVRPDAT